MKPLEKPLRMTPEKALSIVCRMAKAWTPTNVSLLHDLPKALHRCRELKRILKPKA